MLVTRTVPTEVAVQKAEEGKRAEIEAEKLEMYRRAAMSFAKRADDESGHYFAEITDQTGKPVDMPESDRRNLVAGQMLQERGRKLLSEGKVSLPWRQRQLLTARTRRSEPKRRCTC